MFDAHIVNLNKTTGGDGKKLFTNYLKMQKVSYSFGMQFHFQLDSYKKAGLLTHYTIMEYQNNDAFKPFIKQCFVHPREHLHLFDMN